MSQPNNQKQTKWIALSVLILLALSGGVYKFAKRGSVDGSPTNTATVPPVVSQTLTKNSEPAPDTSLQSKPTTGALGKSDSSKNSAPALGIATPPAPVSPMVSPAVPAAPVDQCVTMTYKHKTLASHPDEESCSHHKNELKLQGTDINSKSVCVRVNGTPVHYLSVKGHSNELVFGSVAGPKSKVTVRYCMGKGSDCAKFNEDCTVPKDEFMEAIGGSTGDSKDARLGQWDPSNPSDKESDVMARLDGDVKKELETNDDLNGRTPAGELFKDWIGEVQTTACGSKQASN